LTTRFAPSVVGAALLLAACVDNKPSGAPVSVLLTTIDTILPPGNPVLAHPTDLALDRDGRLFIGDSAAGTIVVLDPASGAHHTLGTPGSGPGQFSDPGGLQFSGDTLWVLDRGNHRVQALDRDGHSLAVRSLPEGRGTASIGPGGALVVALDGQDGALARRITPDGVAGRPFGKPVVAGVAGDNVASIRTDLAAHKIPADLRNLTLPLATPDGGVWLALATEGRLDRYDARDSLLFTYPLLTPERGAIVADFFEANRGAADSAGYVPLSYVVTGRPVGTEMWLLLRMPRGTGTVILAHELNGPLRRRVLVPQSTGIRSFAVDPARRALYLLDPAEGSLLRVPIPAGIEIVNKPRLPG
jgi:hypothetical protein